MKWNDRLREARDRAKVSNSAIAKHCDIADASVSDWMSGKTKQIAAEFLLPTCRLLGVSPFYIMFGEDVPVSLLDVPSDTSISASETLRLLALYARSDAEGRQTIMGAAAAAAQSGSESG